MNRDSETGGASDWFDLKTLFHKKLLITINLLFFIV